jgi:hypothetical protein
LGLTPKMKPNLKYAQIRITLSVESSLGKNTNWAELWFGTIVGVKFGLNSNNWTKLEFNLNN